MPGKQIIKKISGSAEKWSGQSRTNRTVSGGLGLCTCVYTSALVSWFSEDQRERCTHISTGGTDHFAEPGCNYVILHNPNPGWAKDEREKYAHIGAGSTGH